MKGIDRKAVKDALSIPFDFDKKRRYHTIYSKIHKKIVNILCNIPY